MWAGFQVLRFHFGFMIRHRYVGFKVRFRFSGGRGARHGKGRGWV